MGTKKTFNGTFMHLGFQYFVEYMKVILPDNSVLIKEKAPQTVANLLAELGINPLEIMVAKNGNLVPEQAQISKDDEIRIIRIAHGGRYGKTF